MVPTVANAQCLEFASYWADKITNSDASSKISVTVICIAALRFVGLWEFFALDTARLQNQEESCGIRSLATARLSIEN
jgi:hypothetical protein